MAFLLRDALVPRAYLFGRLFFPSIVRDAAEMEAILMQSDLDWAIFLRSCLRSPVAMLIGLDVPVEPTPAGSRPCFRLSR